MVIIRSRGVVASATKREVVMRNFRFSLPTELFFGEGQVSVLGKQVSSRTSTVLLHYGGGSIKKNGVYDAVKRELDNAGVTVVELGGVQPNPRISLVREGVRLCREHGVGLILAVGGGSVIDSAKAIAAGRYYTGDPWDFFIRKTSIKKALPLGVVLTLAATGSEMNGGMVLTNEETEEKLSSGSMKLIPRFSILDPSYTFSLPKRHIRAGIADTLSHVFEQYFSHPDSAFLPDRMSEAVVRTVVHYARKVLEHPTDYESRANLMWASTIGLNGILGVGKDGDWATHLIEHEVSAIYDVIHGEGLAVLTPHWMRFILDEESAPRFAALGRAAFMVDEDDDMTAASLTIELIADFFASIGLPTALRELGVGPDRIEEMARKATRRQGKVGRYRTLSFEDVVSVLRQAL